MLKVDMMSHVSI